MCRIKYSICETIGSVELFAVSQEKTRHAQLINPRILVYSKRYRGTKWWSILKKLLKLRGEIWFPNTCKPTTVLLHRNSIRI
jgi:hypothetical protein